MTKKYKIVNVNDRFDLMQNSVDCELLYYLFNLILLFVIIYLIYKYILSK